MKRLTAIVFALYIIIGVTMAEPSAFRTLSKVPSTHAENYRCVYFDKQGLLWIGTDGGLKCYDGYAMTTYRSNAYSPQLLPNNTVLSITEDHNERLWLGTRNGLVCFDKRLNTFRTYHLTKDNQRIIYALFTDSKGRVWIGTDGGLSLYDAEKDEIVNFFANDITMLDAKGRKTRSTPYSVKAIAEDKGGNIYVGTWSSGLFRFRPGTRTFVRYPQRNHLNSAYSLTFDSYGRLWIGTWGHGIERLDEPQNPNSEKIQRWQQPGLTNFYYRIVEDLENNMMMAVCREGLYIIEPDGKGRFERLRDITGNDVSQSNDLLLDRNGDVWMSTINDGIFHLTTKPSHFRLWQLADSQNSVQSIFTADGKTVWLGLLPVGLVKYNLETGTMTANDQLTAVNSADPLFVKSTIHSIVSDNNGSIWMASGGHGLMQITGEGKCHSYYAEKTDFFNDNYVNTLFTASDGTLWIGQRNCLSIRYNDGTGKILTMREGDSDFSTCDVRGIAEDKNHNIWIATDNMGVIRIRRSGDNLMCHQYALHNGRLPVEDVGMCHEDMNGNIWAITKSGGLLRLDKAKDCFLPVNRKYKIEGEKVFAINEDGHGCLWLSTEYSLVRLTSGEKDSIPAVTSFSKDGDDNGYEFCNNSTFRYENTLFFGGKGGFWTFDSESIKKDRDNNTDRLVVTDIIVAGRHYNEMDSARRVSITKESPLFTRKIVIPANTERFSVVFSLLTYNNEKLNKYAYKLDSENHWHLTGAMTRQASFEGMSPGTYHLHIKAADSYGSWTELPYTIEIIVLPPWYLSWWAMVIYFLIGSFCVYLLVLWYKEHLKTRNRLQMTVILTNITHELLTPLTVISSSIEEIQNEAPQFESNYNVIRNNINRLTRLLRQMLEVRKQQAGQLRLKVTEDDMAAFIKAECDNIMPMTMPKKISLLTNIDPTVNKAYFDRDKLDKIIYNLLSNAVKYNKEGGRITVALDNRGDMACLTVEDEGIGISKSNLKRLYTRFLDGDYRKLNSTGTGIGISLTRDLVLLHHGTIDCQSQVGVGTRFTVVIPITKEAYTKEEIVEKTIDEISVENIKASMYQPGVLYDNSHSETSSKDYTMLIVEDNIELMELMARVLGKKYNVMTARNGQQAWNIIQKQELDIVITDVMMPIMDGIQLTRLIKQSADYGQLPVVMLTAKIDDEERNLAFEAGADEYIVKPFYIGDLRVRVDNIIANRRRIRERFSSQTDFNVAEQHYSNPDEVFLKRAIECVKAHLNDYDRESFARDMCLSSSSLYNKLRAITGQNISAFITSVRLKEACNIARKKPNIKVVELAMSVGFSTPKYFTKLFKEEFGMSPTEYLEKLRTETKF